MRIVKSCSYASFVKSLFKTALKISFKSSYKGIRPVGIVTASEEFLREITRTLKQTGLSFGNIITTIEKKGTEFDKFISQCGAFLVSPSRYSDVAQAAGRKKQVIEFLYTPDEASIKNLNIMLFEGKEHTA